MRRLIGIKPEVEHQARIPYHSPALERQFLEALVMKWILKSGGPPGMED
jgi:hypothetical protein